MFGKESLYFSVTIVRHCSLYNVVLRQPSHHHDGGGEICVIGLPAECHDLSHQQTRHAYLSRYLDSSDGCICAEVLHQQGTGKHCREDGGIYHDNLVMCVLAPSSCHVRVTHS